MKTSMPLQPAPRTSSMATATTLPGNLLLYGACGGTPTYVYDPENRLIATAGTSYLYDGDGSRVEKCTEGSTAGTCASGATGTLYWAGLGGEVLNESDLAASTWKRFVFFNGKMVARRDSSTGNVYYFYSDNLGSIGVVTDALGQTIENESDYYPYGFEIPITTSLTDEHYKFTGKERDSESSLDYFGARHYASTMGRFMSSDPSNLSVDFWLPQTWNRYSYSLNSPLAIVDRNGLWPWYIHNQIIDESFPGLSKQDLQTLKDTSANMDSAPGQQSAALAFEHGMSNGLTGQASADAARQADAFIAKNEQDAQQIQVDWIKSGHSGIAPGALQAFGNALHTITDKLSPAHIGYQPWYGQSKWNPSAWIHYVHESQISPWEMDLEIAAARQAFTYTFGVFGFDPTQIPSQHQQHELVTHRICYTDSEGKTVCE